MTSRRVPARSRLGHAGPHRHDRARRHVHLLLCRVRRPRRWRLELSDRHRRPESFSYVLVDGDGDQDTATLSINVLPPPPNQAPAGADHTVNLVEDVSYTFGISDFGFSDVDGNSFAGVVINTLPSGSDGVLRLGNTPIAAGTVITVDQIKDGGLIYTPVDNVIGNAGDGSFTFSVRDGGGTANGGVNTYQVQIP